MKIFLAFVLFSVVANAGNEKLEAKILDQALFQTQAHITDPNRPREAADKQLQALTQSPELTAQAYSLAAEIMESLVRTHGGDVDAMQKILDKAAKDPAAFLASLPEAQRKKISDIARQIESRTPQH